jgi:HCOMODA/2-hydroxy-3-carboxy-muconic semialdehyde decarboxylase
MTMNRRELLSSASSALPQVRGGEPIPAELVGDLVAANHILATEGIVDGYGHVSVRSPRSKDRFLLSRSIAPESVTTADILEYGLDGEAIDPKGKTSYKERYIHSEIYRARPDVNAVVHCHAPSLIPFGVTKVPLRPICTWAVSAPCAGVQIARPVADDMLVGTRLWAGAQDIGG